MKTVLIPTMLEVEERIEIRMNRTIEPLMKELDKLRTKVIDLEQMIRGMK